MLIWITYSFSVFEIETVGGIVFLVLRWPSVQWAFFDHLHVLLCKVYEFLVKPVLPEDSIHSSRTAL